MIRRAAAVLLLTVALSGVGASAPAVGGHMLQNGHEACVVIAGMNYLVDTDGAQARAELSPSCPTFR